jgi:H+-transporting ATPase
MARTDEFAGRDPEATLKALGVDAGSGLAGADAAARLARYGRNEIQEREETLWHRIFRRFWGPIPWMIEVAAVLSLVVRKTPDFVIILIMLFINAGLDFFQEHRARNALKALKQRLSAETVVLRDGRFQTVPSRDLVPGDIVKLRIGNIVPADVQLLGGDYLLIDQSTFTGESLPVTKKAGDVAYASTIVRQGEMTAVVVNTGRATNFHSVVSLVAKASLEERSHFQRMVIRIGNFLIAVSVSLVALIVAVSILRHEPLLEIIRFALVLIVAAIPVALPAVLSVTMAVGALNLARQAAIVSRLTAIEEMAGVDVFCCDKTGTLTQNRMRVDTPLVFGGADERRLLLVAALASKIENQDPIETPIFQYIAEHFPDLDWRSFRQDSFIPFDPVRKRTEAEVEKDGDRFVAVKGAPQVLLGLAGLSEADRRDLTGTIEGLAAKGYRTLAVGQRRGDTPLEFLGLIPLSDPPREDSREVIAEMGRYGVRVKMVTGDNMAIAREIGRRLGLEDKGLRASQLSAAAAAPGGKGPSGPVRSEALAELVEEADIFAEVVPEDKYRIVAALQEEGHIAGMTGDGVNDAPALKKADCGVAVAEATDAARAAADIILTAPGLGVIGSAIKQARMVFQRMQSYATFRIAETMRLVLFMTLSIVVFKFYPVTAIMIIILALLNDVPIMAIAFDNARVEAQPVRWRTGELLAIATLLGVLGVISSILFFYALERLRFPLALVQPMMFVKLDVAGHSTIYLTRHGGKHFWEKPYPSLKLLVPAMATRITGTVIGVYGLFMAPIGWKYAALIWAYATAWFLFNDLVKVGVFRRMRRRGL